MPIYNFKCESCGVEKEEIVKMNTEEIECECGATAKKAMSFKFAALGLPNGHIAVRPGFKSNDKK